MPNGDPGIPFDSSRHSDTSPAPMYLHSQTWYNYISRVVFEVVQVFILVGCCFILVLLNPEFRLDMFDT